VSDAASVRLGGMVPDLAILRPARPDARVQADGRPTQVWRSDLRRIPDARNAVTVVALFAQTIGVVAAALWWHHPVGYVAAFVLMGRAHAQFASLMHEAAHRLLFSNKRVNDVVGRWLLGYPSFVGTEAYRHVHMAHHREEFGPNEPDIPLYANYPISRASMRRKLLRDASGRTGLRLLRGQLAALRGADTRSRTTQTRILAVQVGLFAATTAVAGPLIYPVFWLLPFLTIWRVINRLRSIAEHGGLRADADRRVTTHSVRQGTLARFFLVPYNIGWHLAHHVDSGIPFRSLPRYHDALRSSGYVAPGYEYPSYRALWRALRTG
jgi:fatty acid desaturase